MAAPQPHPCRPRSPAALPVLMEELVEEILLRIPPDEPAHLFRAALVCKPWRRIILSESESESDTGFLRRYSAFQRRGPPLLGFFYNEGAHRLRPSFVPVASALPALSAEESLCYRGWYALDCRHGRVLVEVLHYRGSTHYSGTGANLIVWDPISDGWQEVHPVDGRSYSSSHDAGMGYCGSHSAVVLCAATDCDHHDCRRGGPFLVVYLGMDTREDYITTIKARVYSSETRAWGTLVSSNLDLVSSHLDLDLDTECDFEDRRAAVIGDGIYFVVTPGARVVKYDLVKQCISCFTSPLPLSKCGEAPVLMQNEDGSLGLASIMDSKLYIWSRTVNNREMKTAEWVQWRVIELDTILRIDDKPCAQAACVTGFAEGVGILFICTPVGTFTFQLESGQVRLYTRPNMTRPNDFNTIFPFTRFFTPYPEALGEDL